MLKQATQPKKLQTLSIPLFLLLSLIGVKGVFAQISKMNLLNNPTVEEVRETCQTGPGRHFATAPLWVWNDLLTEEQIRQTLNDLASQHVMQAFVHPRPGLMTPYLSDDWFRLWKVALDEAEKLDMNIGIYDENSYPSGFAGGFVPDSMPDARGQGIALQEVKSLEKIDENILFVYQKDAQGHYKNVTAEMKKSGSLPEGDWLLGKRNLASGGSWYGGKYYVDLLKKGVTEKFIEITHKAYLREVGEQFGNRIPLLFTDEPHIHPADKFSWTDELPEYFQQLCRYSLVDVIPLLQYETTHTLDDGTVIDWKKARYDYYKTLLKMFIERWSIPNFAFCEENNIEHSGHYWEHDWPSMHNGPDTMAMYAWQQRPAIDQLMNIWSDDVHTLLGNNRSVRELRSAANQLGHARTLSETYGAGGWDLRFEDMKRIGDWTYALGVNTTVEHLSFITIRGARKHDHPQSFSYHASWWKDYHALEDYHTHLSYLTSQGAQKNDFLVIQPTTTAWMYQNNSKMNQIGNSFARYIRELEAAQIEYDLGSEDIIARLGSTGNGTFENSDGTTVQEPALIVGKAVYRYVVLPPALENLDKSTLVLLRDFVAKGGKVFYFDELPRYISGISTDSLDEKTDQIYKEWAKNADTDPVGGVDALAAKMKDFGIVRVDRESSDVLAFLQPVIFVKPEEGVQAAQETPNGASKTAADALINREKLFHQRRHLADGEFLFVCNSDMDNAAEGSIVRRTTRSGEEKIYWSKIEQIDLQSGKAFFCANASFDQNADAERIDFTLPPCGSLALLMTNGDSPFVSEKPEVKEEVVIQPKETPKVNRLSPNVLVVDYCDLKIGDKSWDSRYFFATNDTLWKTYGFSGGNPWRHSVQFRDQLVSRTFDKNSGFESAYRFHIDEKYMKTAAGKEISAVVESAEKYEITCNGKPVSPKEGEWFIDRSFGVIDINGCIQAGENTLTIKASPMNMYCEIMPIFVVGDFSLLNDKQGFIISETSPLVFEFPQESKKEPLMFHSSVPEGASWLTCGVGYEKDVNDIAPYLLFKLEKKYQVCGARIWNYAEDNLTMRGVADLSVFTDESVLKNPKPDTESDDRFLGKFQLKEYSESGQDAKAYSEIVFLDKPARETDRILFRIDSNLMGTAYPIPESDIASERFQKKDNDNVRDNGFVGLSEVELLTKNENGELIPIPGVAVEKFSSQLTVRNMNRKASFLTDKSGLFDNEGYPFGVRRIPSWNRQGLPFYSDEVSYSETFDIGEIQPGGKYFVKLPRIGSLENSRGTAQWNGALAKIFVNGEFAGPIFCEPCECDITEWIQKGENKIEAVITATPKNLFGPHHGGQIRGSCLPGFFINAPTNQPGGYAYDSIPYGLMKPFVVIRR